MPTISLRPDVEDIIEFLDEPDETPAITDSLVLGDPTETPGVPSLAEQRADRRHTRSLARDVRKGAA